MSETIMMVVAFLALLLALLIGIPVAFAIGLVAIGLLAYVVGFTNTVSLIGLYADSVAFDYILVSLPLFVFMAEIVAGSGIAEGLFDCTIKWLSRLPGGLAIATVWASALFGAVCGSGSATAAVIGLLAIPTMLDKGYPKTLVFGTVAGSASLGQIIPPSLPLIIYGVLAEESIGRLFIAGIVPGVLLAVVLSIYILVTSMRNRLAQAQPASWEERFASLAKIWPAVALFVIVLGTIYAGVTTITESAAAGAVGALAIAAVYRQLNLKMLKHAILGTARITAFIIAIMIAGKLFGHALTEIGAAAVLAKFVRTLASPWILLLAISVLWLFLGCFLDMASIMVITIPVLLPSFKLLGWDLVWLGMVMLFNMAVGTITPPVGIHFFVTKGVGDQFAGKYGATSMELVIRSCFPYIALTAIVMLILIVYPPLATWLPSLMMKPVFLQ